MRDVSPETQPGFYFALPRLLTKTKGAQANRTERNWREANLVGFAVFGISYLFLRQLLPDGSAWWIDLLLHATLLFATFLFWMIALYLTSLLVKLARATGFIGSVSDSRAQVVLVAALTTSFAICLLRTGSWTRVVGAIWIIGVVLNFIAAALLVMGHADQSGS